MGIRELIWLKARSIFTFHFLSICHRGVISAPVTVGRECPSDVQFSTTTSPASTGEVRSFVPKCNLWVQIAWQLPAAPAYCAGCLHERNINSAVFVACRRDRQLSQPLLTGLLAFSRPAPVRSPEGHWLLPSLPETFAFRNAEWWIKSLGSPLCECDKLADLRPVLVIIRLQMLVHANQQLAFLLLKSCKIPSTEDLE